MTRWNPACSNSQLPEISSWEGCDPLLSPGAAVCQIPNNNKAERGQPSILLTTGNPLAGATMSSIMERWVDCIPRAVLGINYKQSRVTFGCSGQSLFCQIRSEGIFVWGYFSPICEYPKLTMRTFLKTVHMTADSLTLSFPHTNAHSGTNSTPRSVQFWIFPQLPWQTGSHVADGRVRSAARVSWISLHFIWMFQSCCFCFRPSVSKYLSVVS